MTLVMGIDPGGEGAFAIYDTDTLKIVGDIWDMPIWYQTVGKARRKRVDALAVADIMDTASLMGVDMVVMEAVGGRKSQNAAHAFTFGYGVGIIYTAVIYQGLVLDTVPPSTWKQKMNVPGKTKAHDSAIVAKAEELFPDARRQFKGPKGGCKVDRAEAAIIAKYGGDIMLGNYKPYDVQATRDKYRNADTGG